ncbi:MAG TPA: hypothetical protein VG738_05790 [Chitinophagaceae bacterium]|nr:hypothetical protein [Chitinophagaceae bacterium]
MKSILKTISLLIVIAGMGCMHAAQDILPWRWSFSGVYMNNEESFIDSINREDDRDEAMHNFFLDYKLVLRNDKTFDLVIFKKYMHGTWLYTDPTRTLSLTDESAPGQPLTMKVDSISPAVLALRVDQHDLDRLIPSFAQSDNGFSFFKHNGPYVFVLSADKETYRSEKDDPYSKQNNFWRIKPSKPETGKQIAARVENHISFLKLLMQDVADGKKNYVSLHSFRTPLIIASDDIRLQHYEDTRDAWDENFYDSAQARKGYDLLEKAVLYDGVKPGNTNDRFVNNANMLEQVLQHLKNK